MEDEVRTDRDALHRKQAIEREVLGGRAYSKQPGPPFLDQAGAVNYATERYSGGPMQAPLRERVTFRVDRASQQVAGLFRIQQLLTEHPEFEKFLELQELIRRHDL